MQLVRLYLKYSTLLLAFVAMLMGCMVGPNFRAPGSPQTNRYTEKPMPAKTVNAHGVGSAGKSQHFAVGKDIPAQWWTLFRSNALNDLICFGLANSPNMAAAQAALLQAQETLNAQIGNLLFPAVTAQAGAQRLRNSAITFDLPSQPRTFNLYNASVNVSYVVDVFGGSRRQIEATGAQVDFQGFQLEATYLTLTSNIVTTAITVASLQAQIEATHQIINSQLEQLRIIEEQFRLGGISGAEVYTQQAELAQARATLPPLEKSLSQSRHALAILIGTLPSLSKLPRFDLDNLYLPTELPVSLPSSLIRQRPDVRAAEATLHQKSALIGVATANLLPNITINGAYGSLTNDIGQLFTKAANVWSIGAQVVQPIFNGGALRAQRRAAIAAYDQAFAQYRQTVLQAFQNVADALRAIQYDAELLRIQRQGEIAARTSLRIVQSQYRVGGTSYLFLLNSQRQYQQARINRIKAQAARYTDTAALFQALGGGWWNRGPTEKVVLVKPPVVVRETTVITDCKKIKCVAALK